MTENVNHPVHYGKHPAGIECITIIRHYVCDIANAIKYLWRAGLKREIGRQDAEKEIEDLRKALWYINDYKQLCSKFAMRGARVDGAANKYLMFLTGYGIDDVVNGYEHDVSDAMRCLLQVGVICGATHVPDNWSVLLDSALDAIQRRISKLESNN